MTEMDYWMGFLWTITKTIIIIFLMAVFAPVGMAGFIFVLGRHAWYHGTLTGLHFIQDLVK